MMLSTIMVFLRSHWQAALIGSGALSVVTMLAVQHAEVGHLQRMVTQCHAENSALELSNRELVASVQSQNAAIETLQTQARQKQAKAANALAAARIAAHTHAKVAARIEAQATDADECRALRALLAGVGPR